jgi:hypothetical protein
MTPPPAQVAPAIERKFARLATEWRDETSHLSNFNKRVQHPAYLKIIGMGPSVVPLLLRELSARSGHWFTALHLITEADPLTPAIYGDFEAIRLAWLAWGRAHGYAVRD